LDEGIEAHSAWMRPTAQGENGAVYFVLHNHSSQADELVGASSDAAQAVEIHESTTTDEDVLKMSMLSSVSLESFAEIEFAPGGLHIMLVQVNRDFRLDDHFDVVLHFRNSEDITIKVHVEESAPEDDHPHE
jgi:copper(I)-binding protein